MNYILDTHYLVWRLLEPEKIPKKSQSILQSDANHFLIPTISLLEMQYLQEIGRIKADMDQVLSIIQEQRNFKLISFDEVTLIHSLRLSGTRDPFDRIILSHALALSCKILTQDGWMKKTAPSLVIS